MIKLNLPSYDPEQFVCILDDEIDFLREKIVLPCDAEVHVIEKLLDPEKSTVERPVYHERPVVQTEMVETANGIDTHTTVMRRLVAYQHKDRISIEDINVPWVFDGLHQGKSSIAISLDQARFISGAEWIGIFDNEVEWLVSLDYEKARIARSEI